jgi:hypothetical protein
VTRDLRVLLRGRERAVQRAGAHYSEPLGHLKQSDELLLAVEFTRGGLFHRAS